MSDFFQFNVPVIFIDGNVTESSEAKAMVAPACQLEHNGLTVNLVAVKKKDGSGYIGIVAPVAHIPDDITPDFLEDVHPDDYLVCDGNSIQTYEARNLRDLSRIFNAEYKTFVPKAYGLERH